MTGRHLRPTWTTAPAAAVHAQRTGTQPAMPQPRSPWSNPSPAAHPNFVKKLERSDVIPTNHNCRAEATQSLFNDGSRSNG